MVPFSKDFKVPESLFECMVYAMQDSVHVGGGRIFMWAAS